MRLKRLTGLFLLALAPLAHAQPPQTGLDLAFETGQARFVMFFQKPSISWTGRTANLWIFMALPEATSGGMAGGWSRQTIDCNARTITGSALWPVDLQFNVQPALAGTEKPTKAIAPDSMEESITQVICDGRDFKFNRPRATDLRTAWTQAQAFFTSLKKPT